MELNQQQIMGWLRIALASGSPLGALILQKSGISQGDYTLYVEAALYVAGPATSMVLTWFAHRKERQVLNVKAMPEVATIVVKDMANGAVGRLAADPANPDIVTESKNEKDAKLGTKIP